MDDFALYGHSLFETFCAHDGRYRDLARHYRRLCHSAAALLLEPPTWPEFQRLLRDQVPRRGDWVVRVTLCQRGGRWADAPAYHSECCIWTKPFHGDPRAALRLHLGDTRFPVDDPWRCHKSGARVGYQVAGRLAKDAGADDALIVDLADRVLESSIANLCFRRPDGTWITPPLSHGLLPGTVRQRLLEQGHVIEAEVALRHLPDMSAVIATNAVLGTKPISVIGHHGYATATAAAWLEALPVPQLQTLDEISLAE